MISSYRLGDLFFLDLSKNEINELISEHSNSIGSKYYKGKFHQKNKKSNIDLITEIVLDKIHKNSHLLPNDISESTLIHLRLGDVIAGNEWHEKIKRPLKIEHIKSILEKDTNKKYVIGKCFFAKPSSTNYDECIHLSNIYLQNVINELQAVHFDSGDADIDLCCAVKCKLFIQGKGFFSKLIVEIRKNLHLECIETTTQDE
jgi:hypothetical protein